MTGGAPGRELLLGLDLLGGAPRNVRGGRREGAGSRNSVAQGLDVARSEGRSGSERGQHLPPDANGLPDPDVDEVAASAKAVCRRSADAELVGDLLYRE